MINFLWNRYTHNLDRFLGTTFSKPNYVFLRLTNRCNSRCKTCKTIQLPHKNEMSTDQIKKVITDLKKWLGPFILVFTGGEPTLRKDLWELISFANSLGIRTVLSTNGTLITKKNLHLLAKSGLKDIKISLDTLKSKTYKKIRGKNFSKKVIQTIDLLKGCTKGVSISIHTLITKYNINELPKMIKFVKQKRLNSISLCPVSKIMNGYIQKRFEKIWPNKKSTERIMNKVIRYKKEKYPLRNSLRHLKQIKEYYKNPDTVINERCKFPFDIFYITPAGYVLICGKRLGNVIPTPPADIWKSKEALKRRKELLTCNKNCAILTCNFRDSIFSIIKNYNRLTPLHK